VSTFFWAMSHGRASGNGGSTPCPICLSGECHQMIPVGSTPKLLRMKPNTSQVCRRLDTGAWRSRREGE